MAKEIGDLRIEWSGFSKEEISQGAGDKSLEKFILRFLEKHAGLVVDASSVELFQGRVFYWREIFKDLLGSRSDWTPGETLHGLHLKAKREGLTMAETPTTPTRDPTPGQQRRLDPQVSFMEEFLD